MNCSIFFLIFCLFFLQPRLVFTSPFDIFKTHSNEQQEYFSTVWNFASTKGSSQESQRISILREENHYTNKKSLESDYWKTDRNKIVNSNGNEVWFTGMTWYGLDGFNCIPDDIPFLSIHHHFDLIQRLGFNFIRIPFSTACVNEKSYPKPRESFINTPYGNLTSIEFLDLIIKNASSRNIRVGLFWMFPNLTLPETEPTKQGIWFNDAIPYATEEHWIQTLCFVAKRYENNPTVVGIGLFNEPHDHPSHPVLEWSKQSQSAYNWYRAAKRAGDAIHVINPNLLIFVQGLSDSRDKNFPYVWWGSGMARVGPNLLSLTIPNRVVYEVHDFGPLTYQQEYFNFPGFSSSLPFIWEDAWGFMSTMDMAPILIGEFGTSIDIINMDANENENKKENASTNTNTDELTWFFTLIDYIKSNSLRWTILQWGTGGRHGGLFNSNFSSPKCDKLNALLPIFHPSFRSSPSIVNPTHEYLELCPYSSNPDSSNGKPSRFHPWMILLLSFGFVFIISIILVFFLYFKGKSPAWAPLGLWRKTKKSSCLASLLTSVQFFSLSALLSATCNFCEKNILGSGGFGTVYRGVTAEKVIIAIKKSNKVNAKNRTMFHNEVNLISKMNHCNVVKLLGFCDEHDEQILVYEYMAKGTLQQHLHPKKDSNDFLPLTFDQRLKIALGSSQGIDYLHMHVTENIYHRDIKSENILLDENMQAKISDFGLSKPIPDELVEFESMNVVGTFGYIDPEYLTCLNFTAKSDVYSFGVVLLELITGKYPTFIDESSGRKTPLPVWVRSNIENVNLIMDPNLEGKFALEQAEQFLKIALNCTERSSTHRPTMSNLARELRKINTWTNPNLPENDDAASVRPNHLQCPSSGLESNVSFDNFVPAHINPSIAPHFNAAR